MKEQKYEIVMHVPLGRRYGTMSVQREQDRIFGEIEILNHRNAFTGKMDLNGTVELTGRIISMMRTIPFIGKGIVSSHSLHLFLQNEDNVFEVEGTACSNEEEMK